jgi:hypothetical protein
MGAMFLLGEPFQKNLKAWRESLGLKPEPASKGSPAPEPLPPAPRAPIAFGGAYLIVAGQFGLSRGGRGLP